MEIKIGNTPLIKIKYRYNNKENYIFTKLESYNLTGSIKDRVAYYMITAAYKNGKLKKGMEIVEATSGNTGIALAAMGVIFGNKVNIFMPDWVSKERVDLMKMYNADVTLISKETGGFRKAIEEAKQYAKENNAFLCNQFENEDNVLAYYALNLGIGVGISSGANMIASVLTKEEIEGEIVTIFADDNKKYLSTDLSKPINKNPEFISNKIQILGYEFV